MHGSPKTASVTKLEAARRLAEVHFQVEPGMVRIFQLLESPAAERLKKTPIKLLEVNRETPPSGIMPLRFGPVAALGIPYASVVVEVTPSEFEQLQDQTLDLPEGWRIGPEFSKPLVDESPSVTRKDRNGKHGSDPH